jgi:hypothetical protein
MARPLQKKRPERTRGQRIFLLCLLPFCAYGLLLLVSVIYRHTLMRVLPPCLLRTFTGLKCPSCGMTHSVFALARLDVVTAVRENAVIPALALLAVLRYIELWAEAMGKPRRLIPRKAWFWWGFLAAVLIYSVLRNVI